MPAELGRCGWATSAPEYVAYHDEEWGMELHGDVALFERLSLEAFQSGLSWLVILRKRENFRSAFAGFELTSVAGFDEADVQRLLSDPGIVRNRAKIEATIANARAALEVGDLDALLWSFAPSVRGSAPRSTSQESIAMAKELKRRGFRFVGPTTAHSLLQAVGMVNEHEPHCFRAAAP